MSVALVVIKTEAEGEEWSNTWGIQIGAGETGAPTEADMVAIIGGTDLSDPAFSDPESEVWNPTLSPLACLLAFHRLITFAPAVISNLYVSDGKKNDGAAIGANMYYSVNTNLPCLRPLGAPEESVAALSLAWLLNRNPGGFGVKPGRLYLRYALNDGDIRPGTRDGVRWDDPTAAAGYAATLAAAVSNSGLIDWFSGAGGPTPGPHNIGLPRYVGADDPGGLEEGELFTVTPLASLTSHDPVSRQLTRGRRRRPAIVSPGD